MSVYLLLIYYFQISVYLLEANPTNIRYNSLLSAQCKARCLDDYRNSSQYHRSFPSMKVKRYLSINSVTLPWRSVWERCPRLLTCSSCLVPCDLDPPLLLSNKQTCQAICSTLKVIECEQSCLFIKNLYEQQSKCLLSNNCPEQIFPPTNVQAIERKSRRTVRLKWHWDFEVNSEPVFYVIEAQWTLPKTEINQYELVSKWGFVKEEVSNTKAIIRNIQRDNRWYQFRLAAVTRHGYSTFSMPTAPFRLTNHSMIDPPKNFSIKSFDLNSNTINVTVTWQRPSSSITNYQLSWELKDDPSLFSNRLNTSALEQTIPFLSIDQTYLFKIRSIISPNGNQIQISSEQLIEFNYEKQIFSIRNFQISRPYFHNGLIKTNITWKKVDDLRLKQYDIYWIETQCSSEIYSCCYRRDAVTIQNFFQLYDLRFNCSYLINIKINGFEQIQPFEYYFHVDSCQSIDIQGSVEPPCQIDRKSMDIFSSLPTLDLIVIKNQSGLNFFWQNIRSFHENMFYQFRMDDLILVDLPLTKTNYFVRYTRNDDKRRLFNVSLSLIADGMIRQHQSILIDDHLFEFNNNRSSLMSLSFSLLIVNLIRLIFN